MAHNPIAISKSQALENETLDDDGEDFLVEPEQQDLCFLGSDSRPDDSSDDERESCGSMSSDSSSECSLISPTDSSDPSSPSPLTCRPWEETNPDLQFDNEFIQTSPTPIDRKRKERHEYSQPQEQESKFIRARDGFTTGEPTKVDIVGGEAGNSPKPEILKPCSNDENSARITVPENEDTGSSLISLSASESGMRMIPPISMEPETRRQWERTATQWHSRKLRRSYHYTHPKRHLSRSSKSFSDAEDVLRNKQSNSEEVKVSKPKSASVFVPPRMSQLKENSTQSFDTMGDSGTQPDAMDSSDSSNCSPLPQLDLSTLHHQMESDEPISYVSSHCHRSSDQVMLSPRNSITVTEGEDAIAPSPPVNQWPMDPPISRQILEGNQVSKINLLARQISNRRKQLKSLEEEHIRVYGYKPSHADQGNNKEMKKCLVQIKKLKHELKQIREDPSSLSGIQISMSASSKLNLETTVGEVEILLVEERMSQNRPEDPLLMSPSELLLEKSMMQKQLLMLEKRHGRPSSREEKEIVRDLYDRYRIIKKMTSRFTTVKENSLDLVPILEHETLDLQIDESNIGKLSRIGTPVKSPKESRRRFDRNALSSGSIGDIPREEFDFLVKNEDFNEMDLSELERHYKITSDEKRRLRMTLRESEPIQGGAPTWQQQKEDKYSSPEMEMIYQKYKHTRATLRLLDVLINKRKYPK